MEWIYTRTKVSGRGSLELAPENRKKELQKALFLHFLKQLVQAYLIVSMDVWGLDT
jgi:hypothetical protein